MPGLDVLSYLDFHVIAVAVAGVYCICECLALLGVLGLRLSTVLPQCLFWSLSTSIWVSLRCLNCINPPVISRNFDIFGASAKVPKSLIQVRLTVIIFSHILSEFIDLEALQNVWSIVCLLWPHGYFADLAALILYRWFRSPILPVWA